MKEHLTPRRPILSVPDPSIISCVVSQAELFSLRGRLEGALSALAHIANLPPGGEVVRLQYGDGTVEEMPVARAVAIAALEQLTGIPYRGSLDAPAPSETPPDGQSPAEPSPIPTNQTRWTPRVVSGQSGG